MTPRDAIPRSWLDHLGSGVIGVGMDIATSDGPTSNPASITVSERIGVMLYERLVLAWKTREEAVARAMLQIVLEDLASVNRRPRRSCIDASNEFFFAQRLSRELAHLSSFSLVKGSENLTWQGQTMKSKELLGSLYVNAHTDGQIASPEGPWIKEDRRLVTRSRGLFVTLTGKGGEHGDTFDSGKLANWATLSSGPAVAEAIPIDAAGRSAAPADDEDEDRAGGLLDRLLSKLGF
jgi:hypothetical protein